ncbi:GvpL/GvpF family gas vesicle protein [Fictibacillus sp. NRS-1165]|uniref:GvpL/GvpF family gas vesicle protein n=1 Tax=Fictibacillus sp. NRS-1165 TaxID=3144463 RepID=UPI003D2094F0
MAKTKTKLLYVYGISAASDVLEADLALAEGIGGQAIQIKVYQALAAVLTEVNGETFCQEQIDLHVKDSEWLKEKAFHHHESIAAVQQQFTILPMSFCTIFENEKNLQTLLMNQHDEILQKLKKLRGKQEWNVKMFCSPDRLRSFVELKNPAVKELENQMASMPKGKQFLMKKRLVHLVESEREREQAQLWFKVTEQLEPFVCDQLVRQNWGKEMTEIGEEMTANCDFLIEKERAGEFFQKIEEIEEQMKEKGCLFHVTGPWPPYHFSKMMKESL